jgi:large subunit ribosomal protein L24
MSLRIRKNDQVVVLTGREKGKKGRVVRFAGSRAFVEGVNLIKKFARRTQKNPQGGQVEQEASISLSNLALFCAQCSKGVRFRTIESKDGSKSRVCADCDNALGQ